MAQRDKKIRALEMRKKEMSYSAIKKKLEVSKSTLSIWLKDMPLSRERINELRASSPKRIERYRNTMQAKRDARLKTVFEKSKKDIGKLSTRDIFIAGLFLYWGEGGKTKRYTASLSNTDPHIITFYLIWIKSLGVPRDKIKIRLHLYSDMHIENETRFWIKNTGILRRNFQKPHIKQSRLSKLNQKGFGHGTCNVIVDERDISEYILESLKYLSSLF